MIKDKRSDLGFLGVEFQFRLVKHFLDDDKYFRDVQTIVDQNMFTDVHLKNIVGTLKDFFEKYDYIPSYPLMEIQLREKTLSEETTKQVLETLLKIKDTTTEGINDIKDKGLKFFKQQNMVKAINKVTEIISYGDISKYSDCETIIKEALNVATGVDMGINIFQNMENVLTEEFRLPIPTGATLLDEALEGGLGKGEIALLMAPSGIGKSTFSTAISAHASSYTGYDSNPNGFKVVQIFFEDKEKQIQRKHYGRLTNTEAKDLSKNENRDYVIKTLKSHEDRDLIKNNLILKKFYNKSVGVNDIKTFLRKLIDSGFTPDLVVLDYFECLKMNKTDFQSKGEWSVEGDTYRSLEALADELQIALWVCTQGTKDASSADPDQSKVSGTKTKYDASHVVLALTRSQEDMRNNVITMTLLKNRNGTAGYKWDGVKLNNGIAYIDMSNVESFDNLESYNKFKEDKVKENSNNIAKNILRQKKEEIAQKLAEEALVNFNKKINIDNNVPF